MMLFVIGMFVGLVLGGVFAAVTVVIVFSTRIRSLKSQLERKPEHRDYKDLWQRTLNLRVESGEMTPAQMDELLEAAGALNKQLPIDAGLPQEVLNKMASYDRADLEIDRAKKKLPPADNLRGMTSYDITDVQRARQKYGTA